MPLHLQKRSSASSSTLLRTHLSTSLPLLFDIKITLTPGTSEQNEINRRRETTSTAVSRSLAWHRVHRKGRGTLRDISWVIPRSKSLLIQFNNNNHAPVTKIKLKKTCQMMRQGANSAVRFTTYTTLKQSVQSRTRTGQTLPGSVTFAMGAIAGLVTVYTTMPLECVYSSLALDLERTINCLFYSFFVSPQCDQDAHAVARGTRTIP